MTGNQQAVPRAEEPVDVDDARNLGSIQFHHAVSPSGMICDAMRPV